MGLISTLKKSKFFQFFDFFSVEISNLFWMMLYLFFFFGQKIKLLLNAGLFFFFDWFSHQTPNLNYFFPFLRFFFWLLCTNCCLKFNPHLRLHLLHQTLLLLTKLARNWPKKCKKIRQIILLHGSFISLHHTWNSAFPFPG